MSRWMAAAFAALLAAAVTADPALAQSDVGQKLGSEIKSWATALLLGVAALVGLPALAKRDLSQSMVIALIAVVLGGFVYAGPQIQTVIQKLWQALA